jgi:cytochrome c-type biogenesis protein CcmE
MSPYAKLGLGAVIVACATSYLAYLGASTSWQYYVHVDECVQKQEQFVNQRVRVSGRVAADSLQVRDDRRGATFVLRGQQSMLPVHCQGIMPDNLAEEIDVVVEGTLEHASLLRGDRVLTRCASKYQASTNSVISNQ